MPRATSSSSGPTLRRNQACRTCRKKKLKCDAARPHCGQCVKHWKGIISVPAPDGYTHPEEPQCTYDFTEGLMLAGSGGSDKIRHLEQQIAELKQKLHDEGIPSLPFDSPDQRSSRTNKSSPSSYGSVSREVAAKSALPSADISLPRGGLNFIAPPQKDSPSPQTRGSTSSPDNNASHPMLSLSSHGWNVDLPNIIELRRLVEVFFANDPCGSRILHRPSFLASLHYSPRDPRFPHSALLHAICASASRWTKTDFHVAADGTRRDSFADFHAGKTRNYIDRTVASGANILSVLQACVILSWYFYQEGRWVEVWIFAGFQTRVSVPLRLNYRGTFSSNGANSPGAYLAPPKDYNDLELRRRTWWMAIVFDRIASVGGWLHSIDYRHIATELPLRGEDFENDRTSESNPQHLYSENLYISHPPAYTDAFILFIKAVMLFGLVTDFNTDHSMKHSSSISSLASPFRDPVFQNLDKLLAFDFLHSLPMEYSTYLSNMIENPTYTNGDLYMVHVIPHAAVITLHNPYIDFSDEQSISTERCVNAANAILDAYYTFIKAAVLTNTQSPFVPFVAKLHPFVTICWYLAAVVKIQVCKHMIQSNQPSAEIEVWGEINAMRHAMIDYGTISPIGTRQEKLLNTLMDEIVRSTAQERPLEISQRRLYPFSHKSVFQDANRVGVPMPETNSVETERSLLFATHGMSEHLAHAGHATLPWQISWEGMSSTHASNPPSHSHSQSVTYPSDPNMKSLDSYRS